MAEKRKKVIHIHSSMNDKQPKAEILEVGEIAVNNAEGKEFLSFKNTNNKVVRVSSDEQMVTWMEKKEVMPVNGAVEDVNLNNNTSNVKIKFNQVAAKNTPKSDEINDTSTHTASFKIDMSRYAMNGANPSFSSVTVENKTTTKDLEVTGRVIASDGVFQSSDKNAKENIEQPHYTKLSRVRNVPIWKFNYKEDETHRDIYGVIAQEAEAIGLNELVYTDENGKKSVDYTSLMILKIAYLENENSRLKQELLDLSERISKLEKQ